MMQIIPYNLNINFVGKRHIWIGISIVVMITTIVLFFTKGLNYGIDFTGGAEVQIKFNKMVGVHDVRVMLEEAKFENLSIQELATNENAEARGATFRIKFRGDESQLQQSSQRLEQTLLAKFQKQDFELLSVDVVGPQAGSDLRKAGFLSMFYALLCILIYVGIRFDYRFSPGAVMALIHDSILTIGVFIVFQKEFSLQILAAILTIIGYSNNDTIIVYDRVRESMKMFPNRSIEENINRSINETLSRTILTSFFTLLVTVSLMVWGGGVIQDFAFTMTIGIIVGTYSSIFIASPILIMLTKYKDNKSKGAKSNTGGQKLVAAKNA